MSRVICLLLFLGLPAAFAGAGNDPSAKDLEAMQGDWAVIEYVADGIKSEDDNAQSLFRTIKGEHYTVFIPDKTPGKPFLGIYEIDGDRIKVCYAPPGKDRPTELASKKGSEHTFMIWERERK